MKKTMRILRRSSLPDLTQCIRVLLLLTSGGLSYVFFGRLTRRAFLRVLRREPRSLASRALLALISGSLSGVALASVLHLYVYYGFDYQPDIYRAGSRNTNKVAITFDDGPSREFTPVILDILREHEVPATFFLNHTYRHISIPTASNGLVYEEVIRATRVITTITKSGACEQRPTSSRSVTFTSSPPAYCRRTRSRSASSSAARVRLSTRSG